MAENTIIRRFNKKLIGTVSKPRNYFIELVGIVIAIQQNGPGIVTSRHVSWLVTRDVKEDKDYLIKGLGETFKVGKD
jgi:hypothetical protein